MPGSSDKNKESNGLNKSRLSVRQIIDWYDDELVKIGRKSDNLQNALVKKLRENGHAGASDGARSASRPLSQGESMVGSSWAHYMIEKFEFIREEYDEQD